MKKTQLSLLLFSVLFALPLTSVSQQLAENYNIHRKSAFTENKGQIADQNEQVRNDVKYLYAAPSLKFVLDSNSFPCGVSTVDKMEELLEKAG